MNMASSQINKRTRSLGKTGERFSFQFKKQINLGSRMEAFAISENKPRNNDLTLTGVGLIVFGLVFLMGQYLPWELMTHLTSQT